MEHGWFIGVRYGHGDAYTPTVAYWLSADEFAEAIKINSTEGHLDNAHFEYGE